MRSRIDELLPLAEQNDGLVTASQARALGIADSVLARLTQRGKLERVARGVYRIPYFGKLGRGTVRSHSGIVPSRLRLHTAQRIGSATAFVLAVAPKDSSRILLDGKRTPMAVWTGV